jgi:hypothetical protein
MTADNQSKSPDKGQTNQGSQHDGSHAAEPGEEVKSRSADPGQSSYGGFSNEDPTKQVQQIDDTEQQNKGGTTSGTSGKNS